MSNNTGKCKNYFFNWKGVGAQVNFLKVTGNANDGYQFTAPNPYIILGYGSDNGGATPNGGVGNYQVGIADPSLNQGFPFQDLAQSIMSANIAESGLNQSGFLQSSDISSTNKWNQYLKKYLSDDLLPTNFNRFLWPFYAMQAFWILEDQHVIAAAPSFNSFRWFNKLTDMMAKLFQNSDRRMWLPPAIIDIAGNNAVNTDPYFAAISALYGGTGDGLLVVLELKSIE